MTLATLVGTWLAVLLIAVDLYVSARHARPRARRADEREDARRAAVAARQLHSSRTDDHAKQDMAIAATQHLLEQHPKMKPARARLLVEAAVSELKAK